MGETMTKLRLVLALHNHQPIGNFDGVIEQAYQDSYLPFLDVFDRYPSLAIALHTSGSLMEWLAEHHPEYVDRLAALAAVGRVEVIGGAYYEPILPMIPRRDRVGQIRSYTRWLEGRLGSPVRGMWIPERVWEQSLVSDLVTAGIQYTILDDFHFKNAGLTEPQLHGYYVTEDEGHVMAVFPGSERLRYLIPFASPAESIEHLRSIAQSHPGAVVVFGDDGEKFGTWPETKKHVYEHGWLTQFLDALVANESWLQVTTLAEAIDHVAPLGKVYLPDSSYREMTEWALPADQLTEYERVRREFEHDSRWPAVARFTRGGFWRNFKVKYPESDEMYSRMMMVSLRLLEAEAQAQDVGLLEAARAELYRAQCNCGYWHGAFGGIYLPHLRNAVYRHLLLAEEKLDSAAGRNEPWIDAVAGDFNFDARRELHLTSDKFSLLISPYRGGQLYELGYRPIAHNLLATFTRRPEAYHRKILAGASGDAGHVASIHDRVVFKQPNLDQRLQYDAYARKSFLDRFLDNEASLDSVASGQALERGDFLTGAFEARIRRNPNRVQVQLSRQGNVWGHPVKLTKGITVEAGRSVLEIAYLLEGLPPQRTLHLAVEFNFAGMPAGWDDRYFLDADRKRLGQLGARLDLTSVLGVGLVDEWLGLSARFVFSRPTGVWTFPVESVSQSEAGFELVHQSVAVLPHWQIEADAAGRWSCTMSLELESAGSNPTGEPALAMVGAQ